MYFLSNDPLAFCVCLGEEKTDKQPRLVLFDLQVRVGGLEGWGLLFLASQ